MAKPRIHLLVVLSVFFTAMAHAQAIKVTLLGTGHPGLSMERFGPATLVEAGSEKLLFDSGRGEAQRLQQVKASFADVRTVFFTHLHSDHIVGFPDFWLSGWIAGRKMPLRVFGPAGTAAMTDNLEKAYAYDIHIRRDVDEKLPGEGCKIVARDITQGVVFEANGVKVTAFDVDHGPVKPALGYRVDFGGHSVVISGDTRYTENLVRFAQGTDVLIHEVFDPALLSAPDMPLNKAQAQRVLEHHITPEQAATVFNKVKPKLAVYYHVAGNAKDVFDTTRKTYSGPLVVGEDLMTINIGDRVEFHPPAR